MQSQMLLCLDHCNHFSDVLVIIIVIIIIITIYHNHYMMERPSKLSLQMHPSANLSIV